MKIKILNGFSCFWLFLLFLCLALVGCSSNPVVDPQNTAPPEQGTMKISVGVDSEAPQVNTPIEFETPESVAIFLEVTNATGYHVKTLMDGVPDELVTLIAWDGSNDEGVMVPAGIYMFHLTYGDVSKWTPFRYIQ